MSAAPSPGRKFGPCYLTPMISRTVKGLSLVSLFNDFASEMVYPLLPAFVVGTLGGGAMALGALDGAADLTAALLKIVSGRLSDRHSWRRPLILGGYGVAILVRPLISVASAAWQVIGFRVIDRVGKGIRTAPRDAVIAGATPQPEQGSAFGYNRAADHFGAVLGSLAAWFFVSRGSNVRDVIGLSAVPGIVAFVVLAVVLRRRGESGRSTPPPSAPRNRDAVGAIFWGPIGGLAALTFFRFPETLFLLYLQQRGLAVAMVPLAWAGLHVVRSTSSYPGGRLSDRIGPALTVAAGGFVFAAVALGLAAAHSVAAVVAVFLLLGVATGLTESAERSLVARLAPSRTGRGFGAYHGLMGLAALPSGLLFGSLYQVAGGSQALVASAVGSMGAVLIWLLVSRNMSGAGA
jgi:MFS family permease